MRSCLPVVLLGLAASAVACSSSSRGGSPGGNTAITRLCQQRAALECGETEASCTQRFGAKYDLWSQAGCASEYDALYACIASRPSVCKKTSDGSIILPTADCSAEQTAASACTPGCSSGFTAKDLVQFSCTGGKIGDVKAECSYACQCTCTVGPRTGRTFTPGSCGLTDVERLLLGNCL